MLFPIRPWLLASIFAVAAPSAFSAEPTPAPIKVMIVGVYHMSNPGHDLHNMKADDVLEPKRQADLVAITNALARFKPNRVAVEWPRDTVAERYPKYLDGTLAPSRNEVVQLGFRLAKSASAQVHGIDVDGDFPYEPVKAYADAHGLAGLLDAHGAAIDRMNAEEERLLASKGISAALRNLNDPARLKGDNAFYRTTLLMGANETQPGVDLMTAWYRRNFLICANLVQLAKPGDRVVMFYGSGHSFLLRQCVSEMPGYELVEANDYLPK